MNKARLSILQRLRESQTGESAEVSHRLQHHPRGPLPRLRDASLTQFITKLQTSSASVDQAHNRNELVASVVAFLQQQQQALRLCIMPHPQLQGLPWPTQLDVQERTVRVEDLSVLSYACCAIAETGSLVLQSGHDTPSEGNFLPENFICVIRREDILAYMEDVWDRLRGDAASMPAMLNLISGPSRTADVEQTIQLGAHGPRRLHVIVLSENPTE